MFYIQIASVGPEIKFNLHVAEHEDQALLDLVGFDLVLKADSFFEFYRKFSSQPNPPIWGANGQISILKGLALLAPDDIRREIEAEIARLTI